MKKIALLGSTGFIGVQVLNVVSRHPEMQSAVIRSIIDADNKLDLSAATVKFTLKPHKVFLFNAETEERIRFEVK